MSSHKVAHLDPNRRSLSMRILGYLGLFCTIIIILIPLYFVFVSSLKPRTEIYTKPIGWWPQHFSLESYRLVLTQVPFLTYLRNSVIITLVLTVAQVVLGTSSAYALALLRFPGRKLFFLIVLSALMVPAQVTLIPNYAFVAQVGWLGTFWGVIMPLTGTAFGTFLLRNHFMSLPGEVIEAARVDGTRPLRLLWRVVLPMSWPTLVAFTLITVVNQWNQYMWPLVVATNDDVAPLLVGLKQLQLVEGLTNWGPILAGTVITMLPVLIVFVVLQKQMIKGLTAGAVKG